MSHSLSSQLHKANSLHLLTKAPNILSPSPIPRPPWTFCTNFRCMKLGKSLEGFLHPVDMNISLLPTSRRIEILRVNLERGKCVLAQLERYDIANAKKATQCFAQGMDSPMAGSNIYALDITASPPGLTSEIAKKCLGAEFQLGIHVHG